MQTEALFENIADRIKEEIGKAQKSVFIAVAWFTNKNLFEALLERAVNGCKVFLIIADDEINRYSSVDFDRLQIGDSQVYRIGNGDKELMHNKFCVIDSCLVITGSYNWSYKAETNFENIVITNNDVVLAGQFIAEFKRICNKYSIATPTEKITFPLNQIVRRLEILKNYILLEEIEEVRNAVNKLTVFDFDTDLYGILQDIQQEAYTSALNRIEIFLSSKQQLVNWTDPEIATHPVTQPTQSGFSNWYIGPKKLPTPRTVTNGFYVSCSSSCLSAKSINHPLSL